MATTAPMAVSPESIPLVTDDQLDDAIEGIRFVDYVDESQLEHVMSLVGRDLSEPYSSAYILFGLHFLKLLLLTQS